VLDDLTARGMAKPELVIVDGGKGLEAALASLWDDVPVQRCTVHKERNLLAHAPKTLHDEIKADFNDMVHAKSAAEVVAKRKAFLAKWKLRCRAVADSLDEGGERLFTFLRCQATPGSDPSCCLTSRCYPAKPLSPPWCARSINAAGGGGGGACGAVGDAQASSIRSTGWVIVSVPAPVRMIARADWARQALTAL
jgi:hypothetical protein